jgi:hypothetical protein
MPGVNFTNKILPSFARALDLKNGYLPLINFFIPMHAKSTCFKLLNHGAPSNQPAEINHSNNKM